MLLIKVGGGKTINWDYIARDLAEIVKTDQVIVVHGASATRDEIARKLGVPTKTITAPSGVTSVYTDTQAIDVFLMVYCGLVNKKAVAALLKFGIAAVGLSGIDAKLWQAKRKTAVFSQENGKTKLITDNLTGRVETINADFIRLLLTHGYVPVICPPAISFDNEIVNTDNDWAAAIMAKSLGIKKIVMLFEAGGLLRDVKDPASVIASIKKAELSQYKDLAQGRMKKKLLGAQKAFEMGVETIYWGDGRVPHPVSDALAGKGTVIS